MKTQQHTGPALENEGKLVVVVVVCVRVGWGRTGCKSRLYLGLPPLGLLGLQVNAAATCVGVQWHHATPGSSAALTPNC